MPLQKLKLFACAFILLFCGENNFFGQKLDSLKAALAGSKEDTTKVNLLVALCWIKGEINSAEKIQYSQNALTLAKKLNFQKGIIDSQNSLGACYTALGKYDSALTHLNEALMLATKAKNKIALAAIRNSIGSSYFYMGNYKASLSHFIKSAALYEELKKNTETAEAFHNMGLIYYQTKDYQKAADYTARASNMYWELKDTINFALTLSQFGNIAYDENKYDTAMVYYQRALKLTEILKDPGYSITSLIGIGNILFDRGRYSEALIYDNRVLETARKINDQNSVAIALMNLGKEYAALNKLNESISVLKEAIALSKKIGARHDACDACFYMSETYEKKKDFKNALVYNRLYMLLKDSIFNEENSAEINELTAKYENEKKEKSIAVLNAQLSEKQKKQEVLNSEVKQKNGIIMALLLITVLISASIFLFFSRQKLKQKNKFQAQIGEQQKATASAVIQVQENERNRIAQELHDGIGTFLSTLKINLQALENNVPPEKMTLYKNNTELIDKTSGELRKITKDLSNEILQGNSLANALKEIAERINVSGIMQFHFLSHESEQKPDDIIEANLYRIAQELVNNCLKHSRATQVTLQLIDHGTSILLMLEDNGIGFDMNIADKNSNAGMGLKNIKNRVNFLSGTFKIESVLKKGSTFIIEVQKKLP